MIAPVVGPVRPRPGCRPAAELKFPNARQRLLVGRLALRQAKSVPILDDIKAYLERQQPNVLPKSPEGQAISYALSNWEGLVRYCEDGDLEIDNNGAERSLRGVAVGRKNWLLFGSDKGARTAAILTSFITTCKRLHMDPLAYLRDVFQRISAHPARRLEELLLDKWKTAQNATQNLPARSPRSQKPCQTPYVFTGRLRFCRKAGGLGEG